MNKHIVYIRANGHRKELRGQGANQESTGLVCKKVGFVDGVVMRKTRSLDYSQLSARELFRIPADDAGLLQDPPARGHRGGCRQKAEGQDSEEEAVQAKIHPRGCSRIAE